jgi:ATP-dependent Lhr-like helicase
MRQVACGANPDGVVMSQRATRALADLRDDLDFARADRTSVVIEDAKAKWWTWGGGRANATLNDAMGGLAISRGDDLSIGIDVTKATFVEIAEELGELDPDNLPVPAVAAMLAQDMKFADCLPEDLAIQVAYRRLIDPAGVERVQAELRAQIDEGAGSIS